MAAKTTEQLDENSPLIGRVKLPLTNRKTTIDSLPPNETISTINYGSNQSTLVNPAGTECHLTESNAPTTSPFLGLKKATNIFLAVSTVVFMVAYQVSIPIYTGALSTLEAGSDAYIALLLGQVWIPVIFFLQVFIVKTCINRRIALTPCAPWTNLLITGFMMSLNGILLGMTSPPDRTPPQLQGLLQALLIPSTVIARFLVMRKGISRCQFLCILCLLAGLLISLEPTIFRLNQPDGATSSGSSWYFTVIFGFSWLPAAFGYVYVEKGQTWSDESLVYMAWLQVSLFSFYLFMSWTDFIPGFGMAKDPHDFYHKLKRGFFCFYGADSSCSDVPYTAVVYILAYVLGNMFNLLLIRYSQCAVYSVVVLALVTPLSTIFWSFFSPNPTLHWNPVLNSNTLYLLGGLAIMTPSVVMYATFSKEERPNTNETEPP